MKLPTSRLTMRILQVIILSFLLATVNSAPTRKRFHSGSEDIMSGEPDITKIPGKGVQYTRPTDTNAEVEDLDAKGPSYKGLDEKGPEYSTIVIPVAASVGILSLLVILIYHFCIRYRKSKTQSDPDTNEDQRTVRKCDYCRSHVVINMEPLEPAGDVDIAEDPATCPPAAIDINTDLSTDKDTRRDPIVIDMEPLEPAGDVDSGEDTATCPSATIDISADLFADEDTSKDHPVIKMEPSEPAGDVDSAEDTATCPPATIDISAYLSADKDTSRDHMIINMEPLKQVGDVDSAEDTVTCPSTSIDISADLSAYGAKSKEDDATNAEHQSLAVKEQSHKWTKTYSSGIYRTSSSDKHKSKQDHATNEMHLRWAVKEGIHKGTKTCFCGFYHPSHE
ncbi:uncharacterized protein ACNLHF_008379 [Anomaloglossus baeobatrachus]|uniref:uncharacterized protein LOC142290003 n=1 Tax=Anomaloglossus baeobatrachus TaxID=238106 RepID=UPI003F4F84EF